MKTKYKFIYFEQLESSLWLCKNNKSKATLGLVQWYSKWKQYVFSQYSEDVIFSVDCLKNIIDFIEQLKK